MAQEGRIVEGQGVTLDQRQLKARNARNIAIALALVAFIAVFFFGTMVKMATTTTQATSGRGGPSMQQLIREEGS